ncbi:hypothetical protein BTVI_31244 [Pitangus sulphuratus]|nr:hypothetical protein BTVI_31244 [Pitangus sulphuratus]
MGNTTSCCVSSSPKLRRNAHSRLESYRPEAELSREDTGCNLQHISDRENIDVLSPYKPALKANIPELLKWTVEIFVFPELKLKLFAEVDQNSEMVLLSST